MTTKVKLNAEFIEALARVRSAHFPWSMMGSRREGKTRAMNTAARQPYDIDATATEVVDQSRALPPPKEPQ